MRAWSLSVPVSIAGKKGTYEFLTYVTVLEIGGGEAGSGLVAFDSGLDAGDGLAGVFRRHGLDPRSVTHVFHSHIHVDHFGGDPLFPRALKLVSREELSYQRRWNEEFCAARDKAAFLRRCYPSLTRARSETIADMLDAGQSRYFREETLGDPGLLRFFEDVPGFSWRDRDGDGGVGTRLMPSGAFDSIRVLPTPGHTPHHLSFVVLGRVGSAVVTGDLFPARRSFYGGAGGFIEVYSDRGEAARSLARVVRFGEERGDCVICPAHDRPFGFRSGKYLRDACWAIDR